MVKDGEQLSARQSQHAVFPSSNLKSSTGKNASADQLKKASQSKCSRERYAFDDFLKFDVVIWQQKLVKWLRTSLQQFAQSWPNMCAQMLLPIRLSNGSLLIINKNTQSNCS